MAVCFSSTMTKTKTAFDLLTFTLIFVILTTMTTKIDTSGENDIIFVACHFFVKFLQHDIDDVQCEQKNPPPAVF